MAEARKERDFRLGLMELAQEKEWVFILYHLKV